VSWTTTVVDLGGGWDNLTPLVLAWIATSAAASARFTPQVHRAWVAWRAHRRRQTNGGTVAAAALEQAVGHSFALLVCLLCLGSGMLAAHRERVSAVPILLIPVALLLRAEVGQRLHDALMRALAAWEH